MKRLKTTFIMLAAVVLAGCNLRDDLSDCPPPYNTTLRLHYEGDPDVPVKFGNAIDCITLFVFDEGGQLVKTDKAYRSSFGSDDSYQLYLPSGLYTIACWANATDAYTEFTGSTLGDCRLYNPCRYTNGDNALVTDDPLHFGSIVITIPEGQSVSGDVYLEGFHIDFEVYFKGFGTVSDPSSYPMVEIGGSIPGYGIMKNRLASVYELYRPEVAYDNVQRLISAKLNILPFDDHNDLVLTVRDPSVTRNGSDIVHTIDINRYMADNAISVEGRNEARVSILLEFTGLGITVSMPDWDTEPIVPVTY